MLLAAALPALVQASSPWSASYHALWHARLPLHGAGFAGERTLEWFVNDVLMVVFFFFVVGLELRREQHHGLARRCAARAPAGACSHRRHDRSGAGLRRARDARGLGIPMATDIAFAVGVLALLGPRVPTALRVLLLTLAVIDDLGAILVTALSYSRGVSFGGLGVAALGLGAMFALRALGRALEDRVRGSGSGGMGGRVRRRHSSRRTPGSRSVC